MALFRIDRRRRPEDADNREAGAVWDALHTPLPTINPRYFYDDRGSELFERITELEEYYQTRTERSLLEEIADEIIDAALPHEMVELGSGAGLKVHLLLDAIRARDLLTSCVLLDINESFLSSSARRLADDYPEMLVRGVVGDFTRDLDTIGVGPRRLFVFFAGTIGNIEPDAMPGFLGMVRRAMTPDDRFLVGLDLVKDPARLEAAYNDSLGVTAEFNRNMLAVVNSRFRTDFNPLDFEHVANWDGDRQWIEMRLRAKKAARVSMPGDDRRFEIEAGGEIRTEISCKYTRESFAERLDGTDLEIGSWWTDPEDLFALALVRRRSTNGKGS